MQKTDLEVRALNQTVDTSTHARPQEVTTLGIPTGGFGSGKRVSSQQTCSGSGSCCILVEKKRSWWLRPTVRPWGSLPAVANQPGASTEDGLRLPCQAFSCLPKVPSYRTPGRLFLHRPRRSYIRIHRNSAIQSGKKLGKRHSLWYSPILIKLISVSGA